MNNPSLTEALLQHREDIHPVVPFDPSKDKLYHFDFTAQNKELSPEQIADTESFARYINKILEAYHCKYGIGGYNEHRTLYARSKHFDGAAGTGIAGGGLAEYSEKRGADENRMANDKREAEPRRLHLGIDIWGPAGTKVMAPLNGIVHSFAFNNKDSDYGATLILTHYLEGATFHTLYGHLSLNSLKNLQEGKRIQKGEVIGEFGMRFENGNWPPHLHFQLIIDMQGWKGDYPGVCRFSEGPQWLENCPDPDQVLQMNRYRS